MRQVILIDLNPENSFTRSLMQPGDEVIFLGDMTPEQGNDCARLCEAIDRRFVQRRRARDFRREAQRSAGHEHV